tara:strand:- start:42 stop:581 length:540 start_codon:yes stop_codon:yes gene_type:complete
MKFNYLIKSTPFLSTLILLLFLSISNQKEFTKLKILIWETPSLSLGTYLAISTGSGFILSYLITNNLATFYQNHPQKTLKFIDNNKYKETLESKEKPINSTYDNTLIERDIKDPTPTINASFRIIGRRERANKDINNNVHNDDFSGFEEQYDEQPYTDETYIKADKISSDWNDESYSSW